MIVRFDEIAALRAVLKKTHRYLYDDNKQRREVDAAVDAMPNDELIAGALVILLHQRGL